MSRRNKPWVGRCCALCHGQWDAPPSGKARYCSRGCAALAKVRRWKHCEFCGEVFRRKSPAEEARGEGRFCSHSCRGKATAWRSPAHRAVTKAVEASRSVRRARERAQTYTTRREYWREYNRRRSREVYVANYEPVTFDCRECGESYTTSPGEKRSTFCSGACGKRWARRERRRRHGHDGNYRRRARNYGVPYEPISRAKVLERDGWKCGICGEKIDRRAKAPHPRSKSLDHIIPLSEGGGHTWDNVQAAHFMCNSVKSSGSLGSQLLLIGKVA